MAKKRKHITVSFQITEDLHRRAVNFAVKTGRSLAGLSKYALMAYLASDDAAKELEETTVDLPQ